MTVLGQLFQLQEELIDSSRQRLNAQVSPQSFRPSLNLSLNLMVELENCLQGPHIFFSRLHFREWLHGNIKESLSQHNIIALFLHTFQDLLILGQHFRSSFQGNIRSTGSSGLEGTKLAADDIREFCHLHFGDCLELDLGS